jgi:hydrogenase maturation protein HypF
MSRIEPSADERRVHVSVDGTVQGVGFRPFVFRLANALCLGGFVRNDATGVAIEVEGAGASIEQFLTQLVSDAPPHARIGRVVVGELSPSGRVGRAAFHVEASRAGGTARASVPPDLCTCDDCLRELFDPADRRYRYPFINCTNCGPRFTIARSVPYDRAATTMAAFTMCDACQAEYDDPGDRRFHAQPNACSRCGPRVALLDARGGAVALGGDDDVIAAAAHALRTGAIVAVKGLGGYHLACLAGDDAAVQRLRQRKDRHDKPFAVMAVDVAGARALAHVDDCEAALLSSAARPVVLLRARHDAGIAPAVAPAAAGERRTLGVMLPYAPLHHLLMAAAGAPLVMTSGNRSDEPIAYRDDDALARLAPIADLFVVHDRAIEARCDDSVARVVRIAGAQQTLLLRRSRGFVPHPVALPVDAGVAILAAGGQLKSTACIVRGTDAIIGPHVGDLSDSAAFAAYAAGIEHLTMLSGAAPDIVAHDLHPEYLSTKYAFERGERDSVGVQHHHAHLAACLAEHGERGPAIGLIFDGAGLGTDDTIWGGEILYGDLGACTRVGHLRAVAMPGAEAAVREPWRMACAWLGDAHGGPPDLCTALRGSVSAEQWSRVTRLARDGARAPLTTSVGRLLDACAAICGIHPRVSYEGQAAIHLEAAATPDIAEAAEAYAVAVDRAGDGLIVMDPRALVLAVERDVAAARTVGDIAACVHGGLVYASASAAQLAAASTGARVVVLSGGVFQNVLLLEALSAALTHCGLRVLVPRQLPPNDGGLSYGQAAVAAWQRRSDVSGDSRAGR